MFNANIRQVAVAAIGAMILSTACIGAAIGPVQAATVDSAPQAVAATR
jgi:hypothetical protein